MLNIDPVIPWSYDPEQAIQVQDNLSRRVVLTWDNRPVNVIAGIDVSYSSNSVHAAIGVFRYPELTQVSIVNGEASEGFPYIPGLLAFRVGPAILDAWEKLKQTPDLILIHGHGIAHPRGLGLASHVGVWLNLPTIGVAKTRLFGNYSEVGPQAGEWSQLLDEKKPKHLIGAVLRTMVDSKPIFVSPGNLIDLSHSIEFVLACCRESRLPEPVRVAHDVASRAKMWAVEQNDRGNS